MLVVLFTSDMPNRMFVPPVTTEKFALSTLTGAYRFNRPSDEIANDVNLNRFHWKACGADGSGARLGRRLPACDPGGGLAARNGTA